MDGLEDVFAHVGHKYSYYPNTAIRLCSASYASIGDLPGAVSASTGLTVVWGPAELKRWDGLSFSLAFMAGDPNTGEYFVVIRGTNFESLSSWLNQDFDIGKAARFADLPDTPTCVPADALIAQGTFNGMCDLLGLRDPQSSTSLVEFVGNLERRYLYVTGHSLGGTLTPTLFAYLHATLNGDRPNRDMALWSFAGLTPGGAGFNRYLDSLLPDSQGFLWHIHNSLDVAPLCWWSLDGLRQIYEPYGLAWDFVDRHLLEHLMSEAANSGVGYAVPQQGLSLPGTFDRSIVDKDLWLAQALHQHHPETYRALVKARYPD